MKNSFVKLLVVLMLAIGCSKESKLVSDSLTRESFLKTENDLHLGSQAVTSGSPPPVVVNGNIELFPSSNGYYVQVTYGVNVQDSAILYGSICLEGVTGSGSYCSSAVVNGGGGVAGFNVSGLSHGNTLEAKLRLTHLNGLVSEYSIAKTFVYIPLYDPFLQLQGLPEFVELTPSYSVSGNAMSYWHSFNALFTWPQEYRSTLHTYVFAVQTGYLDTYTNIFHVSNSQSVSVQPSAGSAYVSINLGSSFYSTPGTVRYRVAIYPMGGFLNDYNFTNPPFTWYGYGPTSPHQIKVLRNSSSGILH
jgi:hypothetical protein